MRRIRWWLMSVAASGMLWSAGCSKQEEPKAADGNSPAATSGSQGSGKTPAGGTNGKTATPPAAVVDSATGFNYLTDDMFAVIVAQPKKILSQPWAQNERIVAEMTKAVQETEVDPRKCERIVLAFHTDSLNGEPSALGIFDYDGEVDIAKALNVPTAPAPKKVKGVDFYAVENGPVAFAKISAKRFLIGQPKLIENALNFGDGTGNFSREISAKYVEAELWFSLDVAGVRPLLESQLDGVPVGGPGGPGSPEQAKEALSKIDGVSGKIDLTGETLVEIQVGTNDPAFTTQMVAQANEGVGQAKQNVGLLSLLLSQFSGDVQKNTNKAVRELLASLKIESTSGGMMASVKRPSNFADLISSWVAEAIRMEAAGKRSNDFRQIALAFHNFESAFRSFPVIVADSAQIEEAKRPKLSWRVHILPFLEQQALYEQFKLDEPWDSDHNKALLEKIPDIYRTIPDSTNTTILAIAGEGTAFKDETPGKFASIKDGTSNTLLIVEAAAKHAVPWTKPDDLQVGTGDKFPAFGRDEDDFFYACLFDGSLQKIRKDVTAEELIPFTTVEGAEIVDFSSIVVPNLGGFPGLGGPPGFGPGGPGGPGGPPVAPPQFGK